MNEINDLMSNGLGSNISLWWTLLSGLLLAFLYVFIKRTLLPAAGSENSDDRWAHRLAIVERIYWPVLVLLLGSILILNNPLVGSMIFIFLTAIFWHPLRNYFFGIILRLGDIYKVGQRVIFEEYKGVIKAFHALGLELELDGGGSLDIPYSKFNFQNIIRTSPTSGVLSHGIILTIARPCDLEQEKQRIKRILLAMPYVLPDQKIVYEHVKEDDSHYTLKVIAHGLDQEHMYKVESSLRKQYTEGQVLN